jgi:hypothetical protein
VDEPLAVESAGNLLQDLDAPLAVLDQVVVGGEDAGDAALDGEWGDADLNLLENALGYEWLGRATRMPTQLGIDKKVIQKLCVMIIRRREGN